MGEKVFLLEQITPCFELKEKFIYKEYIGKNERQTETSPLNQENVSFIKICSLILEKTHKNRFGKLEKISSHIHLKSAKDMTCLENWSQVISPIILRPNFTSMLVHRLAFHTPILYIAPYNKTNHQLLIQVETVTCILAIVPNIRHFVCLTTKTGKTI